MTYRVYYITLLGLLFLVSAATLPVLGLGLDEAYYWYWAKHPDLGYLDHPPMVAWIIALSTALVGDTNLGVRLGGFALTWLGFGFAFLAARTLSPRAGPAFAWGYVLLLNLTLTFPGAAMIQTPDTPLFACWMAALYFGARVVARGEARAWYGMGASLGLGMLSKYTMVLLGPCMLLFLLVTPRQRHWLGRREPWLAALLALGIFSPVLIWNLQYDWLSFAFQLNHGLTPDQHGAAEKLLQYLGEQAAVVSPLLFLLFLGYGAWGTGYGFAHGDTGYLLLTSLSWPIVLFFAATSAFGALAEANWPAPAYVAGLLLAWTAFQRHFAEQSGHRRAVHAAVAASLLLSLLLRAHLLSPWLPLAPADDRVREFTGWDRLGQQVEAAIEANPHPGGYFLTGGKGTILAEAVFHTGNRYPAVDLAIPGRYLFLDDPNRLLKGRNAVILARGAPDLVDDFAPYFRRVTPIGAYQHQYRGESIPKHSTGLYLGEDFLGNWEAFDRLKKAR
jgi:4-amino-4-deoxy-L-arabinose transferase-like glycosyltransferase